MRRTHPLEYTQLTRTCFLACCLLVSGSAAASNNLLLILDGSNSMWGQIDGTAKIQIARDVLGDLMSDFPADQNLGLMAYGHRNEGDCADVELLSPIGSNNREALLKQIGGIQPKGKTPIAASLQASRAPFADLAGQNNQVVLISDGLETCDGDPCAVAGELAAAGLDVKVHVIGFDISAEDRSQLECIASAGKGRYFNADSTEGLRLAVADIQKEVAEPPPAPKVYFEDLFDGGELADEWEVINPNPDAFIVEDGNLLLLAQGGSGLDQVTLPNIIRYSGDMPEGDWTLTMRFTAEYQTEHEMSYIGLYQDNENYLVAVLAPQFFWSHHRLVLYGIKNSAGQVSQFWIELPPAPLYESNPFSEFAESIPQPFLLRLVKEGRNYTAAAKLEGLEDATWMEAEKLTLLRQKGSLAIGLLQTENTQGESFMQVDWVKIETP